MKYLVIDGRKSGKFGEKIRYASKAVHKAGEYVVASQKQFEMDRDYIARGEKPSFFLVPVNVADYELIDLFHWQSQSRTTVESLTGQRYINQVTSGGNVLFFVREYKKEGVFASPFTCLGFADFQNHYGSAPISNVWKMKESLPGFVMKKTVKV